MLLQVKFPFLCVYYVYAIYYTHRLLQKKGKHFWNNKILSSNIIVCIYICIFKPPISMIHKNLLVTKVAYTYALTFLKMEGVQ